VQIDHVAGARRSEATSGWNESGSRTPCGLLTTGFAKQRVQTLKDLILDLVFRLMFR